MSRLSQHYTGEAGQRYFEWQQRSARTGGILEARKFAVHVSVHDAVVDFGCGGGFMLEQLQAREKIGIEPNDVARQRAIESGLRVLASVAELEDGSADLVVSNHVLEHTLSPLDEMRELRRILKPNGTLLLWLPIDDWRTQRKPDPTDSNHHLFTWTPLLLANLLTEAGFAVDECRVVTRAWPPFVMLLGRLPKGVFEVLSWVWSVIARRRQLSAVAHRPL